MERYSTALLDLEMDTMAADFDQRFTHDEDVRGSLAFSSLADKGKGFNTACCYEVHLGRVYRRTFGAVSTLLSTRVSRFLLSAGPVVGEEVRNLEA